MEFFHSWHGVSTWNVLGLGSILKFWFCFSSSGYYPYILHYKTSKNLLMRLSVVDTLPNWVNYPWFIIQLSWGCMHILSCDFDTGDTGLLATPWHLLSGLISCSLLTLLAEFSLKTSSNLACDLLQISYSNSTSNTVSIENAKGISNSHSVTY